MVLLASHLSTPCLHDFAHLTKSHSSIQLEFVEELKSRLGRDTVHPHCAVSVDEMKIKSGLVFDKHSGYLTGFIDLGDVNRDMEQLLDLDDNSSRLADQALVFMARSVFKPSLAVPVAHYFSSNLRGMSLSSSKTIIWLHVCMIPPVAEMLFPLVWSVVEALELYDIPAVSLTNDGAKPNRRYFHLCLEEKTETIRTRRKQISSSSVTHPTSRKQHATVFQIPLLIQRARR